VIDGYLVDQEPPIRITTALAQAGIHFERGENVELVDTRTGQIDLTVLPDAIDFEVDKFNSAVVTEHFNRVVAEDSRSRWQRRAPSRALLAQPVLPRARVIRPLLPLNTPERGSQGQREVR
jgi:type I restriction enzyme, R subunit